MRQNFIYGFKKISSDLKKDKINLYIVYIIIIVSILRIGIYGNPNLSIASNDTLSYVESSHAPLFSSEMMIGRRLLSTNLIYKALEPKDGYQILVNGSIETHRRLLQPGFDRIVLLQLTLSILGWGLLAFTFSEGIKNPLMKILGALTIIFFAFTPQIADWDSILMSESFVFSLFALQLALAIKIAFMIYEEKSSNLSIYFLIWAIIFFIWTFLRDTNLFTSLATICMITALLSFVRFRKNKHLYKVLVFVIFIFFLGLFTASKSTRTVVQMTNIYNDDLLHSQSSIATLQAIGMPPPNSRDYSLWFKENSSGTLIKYMLIHPGYPFFKIIKDFPSAFTEIKQTYFHIPSQQSQMHDILMNVGDALHPENTTSFLVDLFLLFGLAMLAVKNENQFSRPWAWLGFWLFLIASITLIPTILGDTWALNRHALFSTMIYRLFMWMFFIIIMDMAIQQNLKQEISSKQS